MINKIIIFYVVLPVIYYKDAYIFLLYIFPFQHLHMLLVVNIFQKYDKNKIDSYSDNGTVCTRKIAKNKGCYLYTNFS